MFFFCLRVSSDGKRFCMVFVSFGICMVFVLVLCFPIILYRFSKSFCPAHGKKEHQLERGSPGSPVMFLPGLPEVLARTLLNMASSS